MGRPLSSPLPTEPASENVNRRHLSKSQRAMAVAKVFPDPVKKASISNIPDGLSKQLISQARTVSRLAPDLVDLVLAGSTTVMDAYKQASLRKSDQEKQIDRLNRLAKANPRDDREPEGDAAGDGVPGRREAREEKGGRGKF
jgi:hypothetical protein